MVRGVSQAGRAVHESVHSAESGKWPRPCRGLAGSSSPRYRGAMPVRTLICIVRCPVWIAVLEKGPRLEMAQASSLEIPMLRLCFAASLRAEQQNLSHASCNHYALPLALCAWSLGASPGHFGACSSGTGAGGPLPPTLRCPRCAIRHFSTRSGTSAPVPALCCAPLPGAALGLVPGVPMALAYRSIGTVWHAVSIGKAPSKPRRYI